MSPKIVFIFISVLTLSCKQHFKNPRVEIQTSAGNIEVELYPDKAPKTVAAFLSYVDSGFYRNSSFYRVLNQDNQPSDSYKAQLIQGGIYKSNYRLHSRLPGIVHETTKQTGLSHKDGTISLARTEPGTASTEFFICLGDQPGFDFGGENNPDKQGYAAFGKVVKGMDIVRRIYDRPEDDQAFTPPVSIYDVVRR
jgi:peptidyl-prolyl cis-trans isomerase A (cyclophilin A)